MQARGLRTVGMAAAAWIVAAACSSAQGGAPRAPAPPEKPSLTIAVGGSSELLYLPLTLAQQLGYFRAEGITVAMDQLPDGADAVEAVTGGSADAGLGLDEDVVRSDAVGKQLVMTLVLDLYPGLVVLVNRKHADAASIKDMASMNIGVSALGAADDDMVHYLFSVGGLDPRTAMTVGAGTGSQALTGFRNDTLQALVTTEPTASMLEQAGDGKAVYDTGTPEGSRDVFGGAWPAGLYLNHDFAKQNPRTVQALVRAGIRALRYIHTHSPAEIAAHLPARASSPSGDGGDRDLFAKVLDARLQMFSPDGKMTADGPQDVLKTLEVADPGTDWSAVDLSATFDNGFAGKVR